MAMRRQEDPSRLPSSPLAREMGNDVASSLYQELHRLAIGRMRFKRWNHTLQPAALVIEAYLPLVGESDSVRQDRPLMLSLTVNIMRHTFSWTTPWPVASESGKMAWCRSCLLKTSPRGSTAQPPSYPLPTKQLPALPSSIRARQIS